MAEIKEVINEYKNKNVAIYGLGTETERFLSEYESSFSVIGLLDGYKESGEIYGYPVVPLNETVRKGVSLIIVVARPGSCKAIAKRIGSFCNENDIALYDVRGRDLLSVSNVSFEFSDLDGISRSELWKKIEQADVVSFDLFDTLITRKLYSYTDIFELVDLKLREKGIVIPDFPRLRLYAEKELSKGKTPGLEDL